VISGKVHLLKLRVAETGYNSNWPVSNMNNTSHLKIMEKKKRRKKRRHAVNMFKK
jgi:hypothetical protein